MRYVPRALLSMLGYTANGAVRVLWRTAGRGPHVAAEPDQGWCIAVECMLEPNLHGWTLETR